MDKAKAQPELVQEKEEVKKKEELLSPVKEERGIEEEISTAKQESLSSGDFVDLGFDVRFIICCAFCQHEAVCSAGVCF